MARQRLEPQRIIERLAEDGGYRPGTSLENLAAFRLLRVGFRPPRVSQQHRVGRYRIDFAWPDLQVGLECDGFQHRRPENAARDALRDVELRAAGWVIFRIDDASGEEAFVDQLYRVTEFVHLLDDHRGCKRW